MRVPRFNVRLPSQSDPHWALIDQGVASAGNFLTACIAARVLDVRSFGIFAIVWGVLLSTGATQSALITLPLSLRAASRATGETHQALVLAALRVTLYFAAAAAALLCAVLSVWESPALGFAAGAALIGWQIQEVTRRSLMAQLRFRDAIHGDVVSYPLQAVIIIAASWFVRPSAAVLFLIVAAASISGAVVQGVQLGLRPSVEKPTCNARTIWDLGKWNAGKTALEGVAIQAPSLLLASVSGAERVAYLQSLVNVVALTHPVMAAVSNVVTISVAREGGGRSTVLRGGTTGTILLAGYLVVTACFPNLVLQAFYGSHSQYLALAMQLQVLCGIYLFVYAGHVTGAVLNGLGQSVLSFRNQGIASAVVVVLSAPLIWGLGVWGVLAAYFLTAVLRAAANVNSLFLLERKRTLSLETT